MFDVNGTRAWWNFFHRFSYILNLTQHSTTISNFDYILILGINLLQCQACRDDAGQFIKTIGDHKSPYEKMHILHNYVNRKLNKPIFEISDSKRLVSDILDINGTQETINWGKLMGYYFDLLFQVVKYIDEKQLGDLKEFSAYIYRAIDVPKRSRGLAINVEYIGKYSQELIKMQIYEYYRNVITSLNLGSTFKSTPTLQSTPTQSPESQATPPPHTLKTYQEIYGNMPKINKTCKSCAKRHTLYLESHNTATSATPAPQPKIITPIEVPQITTTPKSVETIKTQPQPQPKLAQNPPTKKTKAVTPTVVPKAPASTSNKVVPSLVKLPPKLQKPVKTKVEEKKVIEEIVVERTIINNQTNNNQTNNDQTNNQTNNQEEVAKIRKKIVIVPKAKKAVGVRKDKRKIIFQSSRIIRYQQNRVKSAK